MYKRRTFKNIKTSYRLQTFEQLSNYYHNSCENTIMFDGLKLFDRLNTDSILKFLFTVTIVFDEPFLPWPVRENLALGIHHVII